MELIWDLFKYQGHLQFASTLDGVVFIFSNIITIIFTLMYLHQFIYLIIGTIKHTKITGSVFKLHTIGIVISARNESKVIGNLIKSIRANDYPQAMVRIFVIADNCTDNTAEICRNLGCVVFERFNKEKVGKGYALNYLFTKLHTEPEYAYMVPDAYIVLDADNVIKPNFITEMNKVYDSGYNLITSYRNSKNFGENWLTSGYGIWFLHEARHLNNCRMMNGTSCAISGTGFLIDTKVVKEFNNWEFFTLTEDIQCSTEYALTGRKVGYCSTAELYDEQPNTFRQAWRQRERWAKGFYQVFGKDGWNLIKNCFRSFSCWDILTTIFPALLLTMLILIGLPVLAIIGLCTGDYVGALSAVWELVKYFIYLYTIMFVIALLVVITEWKHIKTTSAKKILYLFTFPVFMFTYVPISIVALFKKVEWKPIVHTANLSIEEAEIGARVSQQVADPIEKKEVTVHIETPRRTENETVEKKPSEIIIPAGVVSVDRQTSTGSKSADKAIIEELIKKENQKLASETVEKREAVIADQQSKVKTAEQADAKILQADDRTTESKPEENKAEDRELSQTASPIDKVANAEAEMIESDRKSEETNKPSETIASIETNERKILEGEKMDLGAESVVDEKTNIADAPSDIEEQKIDLDQQVSDNNEKDELNKNALDTQGESEDIDEAEDEIDEDTAEDIEQKEASQARPTNAKDDELAQPKKVTSIYDVFASLGISDDDDEDE